jgi:ADP-ribose pyrophosphatase YjhB (NUDIX family)
VALRYRIAGAGLKLYWRLLRPRTFGVRAVVRAPDGRVALVRHVYVDGWYLPGGGVDKRESAHDAVRRELAEEVALTNVTIDGIVGVYHNRAEAKDDHVVVFACRTAAPDTLVAADRREIAEAGWFAPTALPEGTSPATRRRIAEALAGGGVHGAW